MLSARRAYQLSGLLGLLVAAVLGYQAARLPYYTRIGPGPGFFPRWLCGILALLSLAILARAAAEQGDQQRAGRLWGALEREAERGPIGQWEAQGEGDQYTAAVLARTGAEFERARQEGRRLALDAAVELALAAS